MSIVSGLIIKPMSILPEQTRIKKSSISSSKRGDFQTVCFLEASPEWVLVKD